MNRVAVLSLDIEDWYHLDYFAGDTPRSYSMLDGIDVYQNLLARLEVSTSCFVLGELIEPLRERLLELVQGGADIGVHGWTHQRPLTMTLPQFKADLARAKTALDQILGRSVEGYRAPCYSLDRERLEVVRKLGFKYDSSRIDFSAHVLYGSLDLTGFSAVADGIYRQDDFFEFELSTLKLFSKRLPVSGGGYLRIFPWWLMKRLVARYIANSGFYTLYIHPFELSKKAPLLPADTSRLRRFRFQHGLGSVEGKLFDLIALLKDAGFTFTTFADLRRGML